ncbi:MAG TPA: hypothetical protein VFQ61_02290 [Polyangiaceae bacterium]|nr:hypothetical protein [Polyangiaceae bacterium]
MATCGLVACTLDACAPALSSFTPAHVAAPGHVQAEVGTDVSVPRNTLADLYDITRALDRAAQNRTLTQTEQRQLLRGATSQLLNPLSANSHLGLGVGVYRNLEAQGRLFTGGWRLGARLQFLSQPEHGLDASVGLGVGRYSYSFGIPNIADVLEIEDYGRWMVDVPVLVGKRGDWYRWWGGPKALLGTYRAGASLNLPAENKSYGFDLRGTSGYVGAQLGGALGYKHLFFAAELSVMYFTTRARFTTNGVALEPYEARIDGLIWYPGVGLLGEF